MVLRSKLVLLGLCVIACGGQKVIPPGETDGGPIQMVECHTAVDCALGRECKAGRCVSPQIEDAGNQKVCTKDDDCAAGQQCVKSTGDCEQVKEMDAGIPDAGPP